jgi:hypothetical protein
MPSRGIATPITFQLMVARVFEAWMRRRHPILHQRLRWLYNRGSSWFLDLILKRKESRAVSLIADGCYLLLKPVELLMIIIICLTGADLRQEVEKQLLERYGILLSNHRVSLTKSIL